MPGRVLERAVYIRSEPLHFCGEFFSLVCFRLVGWSAGHRCGAAAGVQLTVVAAGEHSAAGEWWEACDTQSLVRPRVRRFGNPCCS